jgi:hypothetical protein
MQRCALVPALSLLFLVAPNTLFAPAALAQEAPDMHSLQAPQLAPADEYFGRYRMSVLGMRNAIRDIARRVEGAPADEVSALYAKLTMVEDAILDLRHHYPRDTWLPRLGLSVAEAFALMPVPGARIRSNDDLDWVIADFPATNEAFYAYGMRRARLQPVAARDVPIEPELPSYAVPPPR